jgi:plasmid stability protein
MPINRIRPVTVGTRQNLINGLRARPMSALAVQAAFDQAATFTQQLVDTYSTRVAAEEVGENGSAMASNEPILSDAPTTVLMYGRVQSGKTAAMILTSALAIDNRFRVVIVLTANNVALVSQTANRFKTLDGPRVFSTVKQDDGYEWEGQEEEIREDIQTDGIVLISAKDAFHLPQVIRFLQQIGAPDYPTIIFDDEADAATPDTTLAARSMGHANAPAHASTINRRIIANDHPGEEGESIREMLPHSLYVQVTATPFVLLLQNINSRIRPHLTFLLQPGDGYCGGREFFGSFDISSQNLPQAPLVFVPDAEGQALNRRRIPEGLASSINFFLISAAAKAAMSGWPREGYKHLSHPSRLINQHSLVAGHIDQYLRTIRRELRDTPDLSRTRFTAAYEELQRTVTTTPPLDDLLNSLPEAIRQADVRRVNSETSVPEYGPRLTFLIGGDILGRGITIDDLLVTYYVREAQISQMDTVWQHARMYGYRIDLMPFTRVYLPRQVAVRFKGIHEAEEELRELLRREATGEEVPIRLAIGSRATRSNALELSSLRIVQGSRDQLYPHHLIQDNSSEEILELLTRAAVPLDEDRMERRATVVPFSTFRELSNIVPVRENDPGQWNSAIITAIIESYEIQYAGEAVVYVRGLQATESPDAGWLSGRLGGAEITAIRRAANGLPALALMYVGSASSPTAWYPTLVMPDNAANYIIHTG